MLSYSDTAEGEMINFERALQEGRDHHLEGDDLELFRIELLNLMKDEELVDAGEVMTLLGY